MDAEPVLDGLLRLRSSFHIVLYAVAGISHSITISAGYHWDGATIPRILWPLIGSPFEPRFWEASLVHDWYCETANHTKDYQLRVIGDSVFLCLLARAGVPYWRRALMFGGVRINSWWRYSRAWR
jgi:hypothetical protein